MKKIILFLSLIVISFADSAYAQKQANSLKSLQELCVLEEPEDSNIFDQIVKVDIKEADSISDFLLKLVNKHLIQQQYTDKELTYDEVKALFSDRGEQGYNDLYIEVFGSRTSGNVYVEVKSYPGDNPYALIFDGYDGKVVASNQDDSISLITNKGLFNCQDLENK